MCKKRDMKAQSKKFQPCLHEVTKAENRDNGKKEIIKEPPKITIR